MAYFGKLVGIGRNRDGNPFGIYGLAIPEGHGDMWRLDVDYQRPGSNVISLVKAVPFGEKPARNKENVEYKAIIANSHKGATLISSGVHADKTWEWILDGVCYEHCMAHGFINNGGAEPDSDRTPRIAAAVNVFSSGALGIGTGNGVYAEKVELEELGKAQILKTCTGEYSGVNGFVTSGREIPAEIIDIYGSNVQKIADNLYDFLGPEAVSSAAVLWTSVGKGTNGWKVAARNRHK